MDVSPDDLAGIVDLFGALERTRLRDALAELAFKRGHERDPATFEDIVQSAIDSYHLLDVPTEAIDDVEPADGDRGEHLVVAGPVAFPTLPEGARDLPHILEVPERSIEREALATAGERRFRNDAGQAVAAGDRERIRTLLDVSYDLEAWAPVDLAETRRRLDEALAAGDE